MYILFMFAVHQLFPVVLTLSLSLLVHSRSLDKHMSLQTAADSRFDLTLPRVARQRGCDGLQRGSIRPWLVLEFSRLSP